MDGEGDGGEGAEVADGGDGAGHGGGRVGGVACGRASSGGVRGAVANHKACCDLRLVISTDEGVVEGDFGHLARTALLPAVRGCVAAPLHALVTPRAERQVGGGMCISHCLRRGAWVSARPCGAGFFGGVLRLVRLSIPGRRVGV